MTANSNTSFDVAVGTSRNCTNWKNKKMSWSQIVERLKTVQRTGETFAQFKTAPKGEKEKIKDVGGFVGGFIVGGRRLKNSIRHRQLIALDADFATAQTWSKFKKLFPRLAACVYSTHSHSEESQKLRIIIPLSRPVDPVEYMAATRWMADRIGMSEFDPTTFEPERLMFWPSAASDGVFFADSTEGPFIDPDAILQQFTDWRDASSWPISDRETRHITKLAEKQGDPLEKTGLVGAFCRAFSVTDAIERFLPEKYEPGAPGRFSYIGGTAANGLVIYDDDRFAYSHHGTDPASGKLCNAFDLVRIHLFSAEDEDAEAGTKTVKLPSYLKMTDFVRAIPEVKRQTAKDRISAAQSDFEGLDEEDEEGQPVDPEAWTERLTVDRFNNYENTIENVVLILQNEFKNCFRYNEFKGAKEVIAALPWRSLKTGKTTDRFDDDDSSALLNYLEKKWGISIQTKMEHALNVVFQKNRVHPVREYLTGTKWDGRHRVDTLICDFLGAADTDFTRAVTRKMLVAAVARVFTPGCDFHWCLVLVGKEGTGKSTIIRRLGQKWFSDSFHTVQGKEAVEQLTGNWLIEIGELAGLNRSEVTVVKHFLSKNTDISRPAYGRHTVEAPRQCVFIGTTNELNFLRGSDGNRRFWPVVCGVCQPLFDVFSELTQEYLSQVWAEAVELFKTGETLHLSSQLEKTAGTLQKEHGEKDDRAGSVEEYLNTLLPKDWSSWTIQKRRDFYASADLIEGTEKRMLVTAAEIWVECFGRPLPELRRQFSNEIYSILNSLPDWRRVDKSLRINKYGVHKAFQRVTSVT